MILFWCKRVKHLPCAEYLYNDGFSWVVLGQVYIKNVRGLNNVTALLNYSAMDGFENKGGFEPVPVWFYQKVRFCRSFRLLKSVGHGGGLEVFSIIWTPSSYDLIRLNFYIRFYCCCSWLNSLEKDLHGIRPILKTHTPHPWSVH